MTARRNRPVSLLLAVLMAVLVVVSGCRALGLSEPNHDDLRDDLAGLPGVAEATVDVITEDTELWTSAVAVVVEQDASAEEVAEVVEVFEEVRSDNPGDGLGLAVTVAGEPRPNEYRYGPNTSVLSSTGEARTSPLDRARWFLTAREALPAARVNVEEDMLIAQVEELTDALTTVAEDPVLRDVRHLHLHGGRTKGARSVEYAAQGPIASDVVHRLEGADRALRALPDMIRAERLFIEDGGVPPYGRLNGQRAVTLELDSTGRLEACRADLEAVLADLMTASFEPGEPATFEVKRPNGDPLVALAFNESSLRFGREGSAAWQRFAADVAARELA